ncbi:MAG: AraC family transcriptional regulator [Planctomycetota bacterium]|nr:AraC family transcriptional regulator [Planctomycetota bacterium]
MSAPRWYLAGPLKVQVLRATPQPLQAASGELIVQRAARERWARETGIYFGPARTTVLLYVLRGVCRLEHGPEGAERIETAGASQLLAVPPGARYRFRVDGGRDLELGIANATGAVCERWWAALGGAQARRLEFRRRREIERALEDFLQYAPSRNVHDQAAGLHCFQAFLNLAAGDQAPGAAARSRGDVHADRCRDLIEEQFERYGSLGQLAAALDLHPDYLTRAYRERFHASPAEHLRKRKMEQASVWLREGERTHAEIAEALGFSDAFSFSKCFKAYAGLSPRHWREQFKA